MSLSTGDRLGYTILSDANAQAALALGKEAFRVSRTNSDRAIERRRQNGDDIESSPTAQQVSQRRRRSQLYWLERQCQIVGRVGALDPSLLMHQLICH